MQISRTIICSLTMVMMLNLLNGCGGDDKKPEDELQNGECAGNYYGKNCDKPVTCINGTPSKGINGDGHCLECDSGYWGKDCLSNVISCQHGTPKLGVNGDGTCAECAAGTGWSGLTCNICAGDYWGEDCDKKATCLNGVADNGVSGNGHCLECNDGYWGEDCNKKNTCVHGTPNGGVNGDGTCKSCTAGTGWTGSNCDVCEGYGKNCTTVPDCTNGDFHCNGKILEACENNNWVTKATCNQNQYCEKGDTLEASGCRSNCGDGQKNGTEACDGTDLGEATCASVTGKSDASGSLACSSSCEFDTSACTYCGDTKKNGTEACDGNDFGEATCASVTGKSDASGSLACSSSCEIDASACTYCGDTKKNGNEACDGTDLGEATCASVTGKSDASGSLACSSSCEFDTSACTYCGDSKKNGNEACDGTDLGEATCASVLNNTYAQGSLTCSADCQISTASCTNADCTPDSADMCTDNVYKTCVSGLWEETQTCAGDNPICKVGSSHLCVAMEGSCTGSDIICNGNVMVGCEDGDWVHVETCSGATPKCEPESLTCVEDPDACSPGSKKCSADNKVMLCSDTFIWEVAEDCPTSNEGAKPVCSDGQCVVCLEGDIVCDNSVLQMCMGDNWKLVDDCSTDVLNSICDTSISQDQCVADCTPNKAICHNTSGISHPNPNDPDEWNKYHSHHFQHWCDDNKRWVDIGADCNIFQWCNFQWMQDGAAYGRLLPGSGKSVDDYEGRLVCTTNLDTPLMEWPVIAIGQNATCDTCGDQKEFKAEYTLSGGRYYCTYEFRDKFYENWYACMPNFESSGGSNGGAPLEIFANTKLLEGQTRTISLP